MERNRKRTPPKRRAPQTQAPEKLGYSGKLLLRIFGSVLLILAAIFIKQNAPQATRTAQNVLAVWTVSLPPLR